MDLTAAQAIAIYELVEQCPSVVTEPVCLPDPTTMQQLIGESAVTSSRGKEGTSGDEPTLPELAVNDHSTLAKHDNSDGGLENKDSLGINQITEQLEQLVMLRMELVRNFGRWIPIRQRSMEQLKELETKLHKHHRDVNTSTIIGSSLGTAGIALWIASLIATYFIFDAGLVPILVGAGIVGAMMYGTNVFETILEKLGLKNVQAAIKEDHEACTKLQQQLDCLDDFITNLVQFLKPLPYDAILLRELKATGFDFLRERIISNDMGSSTGERVDIGAKFFRTVTAPATITTSAVATAGAVARGAALAGTCAAYIAGSVAGAALIPLDITLLVKSSLELHRGSTSSAVEEIRQIINDLKCPDVEEIKGLVESFIHEKFTEAYNKMDDETNDDNNYEIQTENGTSAAQAIATDDLVEQCPSVVTEPGESAVTSSRGNDRLIKLTIKITVDLNEEEKKDVYDMLMLQASKFIESHNYSKVTGVRAFVGFLEKAYDVTQVPLNKCSLIISLNCKTLKGLDQLWNDYLSGHLIKVAELYLMTDEIKKLNQRKINWMKAIENDLNRRKVLLESSAVHHHSRLVKHDNSGGGSENKDSLGINQITEQLEQLRMLRMNLTNDFVDWIPIRQRTMEQLKELATKLHQHHRNVNISTITGASMGTVGGALSIAGFIAAPFTLGAGLIVSLVGAGIGGAGGLVMSGSKVVEIILEKLGLKDVQAAIKEDYEACTKLQQQLDCLEDFISKLAQILKPLNDDAILLRELEGTGFDFLRERIICDDIGSSTGERVDIGAKFFRTVSATATITTSAVATAGVFARSATAGAFARSATAGDFARSAALAVQPAAQVAGFVISAVLIPLDITLLVKSSLKLHRGSTSSAVEEIRQIINDLKCPDVEEIKGLVESFIDEKFIEAYNKMDDETNEENCIDVDLEDNSDDKNYEIQIEDSEERRETDGERMWGEWILVPSSSERSLLLPQ
ncbi:PREDICTED: uncharacterized protein LOC107331748 isoform X2 [Acropora digitifera]|uniref:uncharacterized protein LOC107331748 isoform X2 n=1 Tax=Acropora digitifera TaxID=70779 RepID=UPI00077AA9BF|nr:PREDICTED: uncharacterized protein LOC107331748 isoform X2 [Acropora digitifera]